MKYLWLVLGVVLMLHTSTQAFTIAELNTELTTDPVGLGYAPLVSTGKDADIVSMINLARAGGAYQVNKGVVATATLFPEFVIADLTALLSGTPVKFPILQLYMTQDALDLSDQDIKNVFLDLFPNGTTTRTNLQAFFKKQGSRAEVLWGIGFIVTQAQVSCALRNQGC